MSDTPRTDAAYTLSTGAGIYELFKESQDIERELNAANQRIKRLEEALGLVLKMRNDWLENQENGYAGAYYAFVKGNDSEWDEIIKSKEAKL